MPSSTRLCNAIFDPALSALILDLTPAQFTARMMGLKGTVGSLGNMLGPSLVVLVLPFIGTRVVFLISAVLVLLLTLAAMFALRVPQRNELSSDFLNAAVSQ
jgi:MFS family permease